MELSKCISKCNCSGITNRKRPCKFQGFPINGKFLCHHHNKNISIDNHNNNNKNIKIRLPHTKYKSCVENTTHKSENKKEDIYLTDICPVCLENIKMEEDAKLECKHSVHLKCVLPMLKAECPICRLQIKPGKTMLNPKDIKNIENRGKETWIEIEERESMNTINNIEEINDTFDDFIFSLLLDRGLLVDGGIYLDYFF